MVLWEVVTTKIIEFWDNLLYRRVMRVPWTAKRTIQRGHFWKVAYLTGVQPASSHNLSFPLSLTNILSILMQYAISSK